MRMSKTYRYFGVIIKTQNDMERLISNRYYLIFSITEGWYFEDAENDFIQSQLFESEWQAMDALEKGKVIWEQ